MVSPTPASGVDDEDGDAGDGAGDAGDGAGDADEDANAGEGAGDEVTSGSAHAALIQSSPVPITAATRRKRNRRIKPLSGGRKRHAESQRE
jgi:hypothetical protein